MVSRHDYLPFGYDVGTNYGRNNTGQQNSGWGQTDYVRELFTGQSQDTETQFDWFRTRYYTYLQGRFHSPDPENAGVDLTNPQSWNAYAYVNNSPLSNNDPWVCKAARALALSIVRARILAAHRRAALQFRASALAGSGVAASRPCQRFRAICP
jgi:RHS repeat-associated protein